ncbi:uncharacterized protein [Ptychodera flava]|uniref:uncharacterized protein isoform X2 n=1 Tax=Ptychodera flava TaxID=63121 RepID=UPI003969D8E4
MTAVHPKTYVGDTKGLVEKNVDIESIVGEDHPVEPVIKDQPRPATSSKTAHANSINPTTSTMDQPQPSTTFTNVQPPYAYAPPQLNQQQPNVVGAASVPMQPMQQGQAGVTLAAPSQVSFDLVGTQLFQEMASVHKSHKQLTSVVQQQAQSICQTTTQHYQAQHDNMSYEQILSTLLFEGERLLLGGQYIYYTNVTFLDENGSPSNEKPPMTKGRAFLTTNRMLLLSAEGTTVTSLSKPALTAGKSNVYNLSVSCGDSMYLQSIPMEGFRSVDLRVTIGVRTDTSVQGEKPPCNQFCSGICCCFARCCSCCELECCAKKWSGSSQHTQSLNERHVTIGTLMPPWGRRMMVKIHFDPSMRLLFINEFLVEMQRYAKNLNKLDLAPVQFLPCQPIVRL